MRYTALSPWAEVDYSEATGIKPRPDTLSGKTIGMFAHFKEHSPVMLRALEPLLRERLPDTAFTHLQYPKDTSEMGNDREFQPVLHKWLEGVDAVIAAYGDAGSCAMFHAYNTALIEKLGKPCVMLVKSDLLRPAQRGAAARHVPAMRFVPCEMLDLSLLPKLDEATLSEMMYPFLPPVVDGLVEALTRPLAAEEAGPAIPETDWSKLTVTGDLREVNDVFYKRGWTNGAPVIPPTEEAVAEMLKGTDLPRDRVVGLIPPMLGKATAEKIAINGVMAGCLPTYMPVLIAAVRGMLNPEIHLEGWTCSVSSWAPYMTISGPVAKQLNMNGRGAVLSPYFKAQAVISRAVAYMVMNIGGVRPILEDMSELGHESRFGVVIAEDNDESPWEALHEDYGLKPGDSALTMFWPRDRVTINGASAAGLLEALCAIDAGGWAPGAMMVISPRAAKLFAGAGWGKQRVLDYIVEYSRKPGAEVPVRWLTGNNHLPASVDIPASPKHWTRRFWDKKHLFFVVGGSSYGHSVTAFLGGGDHGGPSCTKLELPANWDALAAEYADVVPDYIQY